MYKEVEVDVNLYNLSQILTYLDSYKFDNDITNILNNLKKVVDKKMFSNYDICDEKIIIKYLLKK